MKVSLFASANRPKLWPVLFKSLEGTSVEYEIIFTGNIPSSYWVYSYINTPKNPNILKEINTKNIKPAQCYEIARRQCTGEVIVWTADDAEYPNNIIGKAYEYWKAQDNEKLILSIQTKETGYNTPSGVLFDMNIHRFFGGDPLSPLMAPLGMMSRKFLNELGGIDQRYVCGQYENDVVMRAYSQGATVEIFGDKDNYIDIDHLKKSIEIGESTNHEDFRDRPFAKGYMKDREVLEGSWCKTLDQRKLFELVQAGKTIIYPSEIREISKTQLDTFQPYPQDITLTYSLSNKGIWD